MINSLARFRSSIKETKNLTAIYDYLTENVRAPVEVGDLLRSKVVYAVSALDKLMHDIIRIGMVEIYEGKRAVTPKYNNEPIKISIVHQLLENDTAMAASAFDQAVAEKLKILSFQDPDKIADGLSFIWAEKQKWQKISHVLEGNEDEIKKTLKLIVSRRNSIVHESDYNPVTGEKNSISRQEAVDIINLIEKIGVAVVGLVK